MTEMTGQTSTTWIIIVREEYITHQEDLIRITQTKSTLQFTLQDSTTAILLYQYVRWSNLT
jgi:hypothetical protein